MNRVAVFAHFDKDNLIADYVLYYLNGLRAVTQKIIFVSDCQIEEKELAKLDEFADVVLAEPHGQYDFGSYKRGFVYALENNLLEDADELVFANDSCYAPLYPFLQMFETMKGNEFWGVTKNSGLSEGDKIEHLQSYFLVFGKKVFSSTAFFEFINGIKKEENKFDVITNYEIGLTKHLVRAGFEFNCYAEPYDLDPCLWAWRRLVENDRSPFIKVNLLNLSHLEYVYPFRWQKVISANSDYPIGLIKNQVVCPKKLLKFFRKKLVLFGKKLKQIPRFITKFSKK